MDTLLYEYDNILIGKKNVYSDIYFKKNKANSQKNALAVMRYAFTRYLRWTPEAISEKMTKQIMIKLHLQPLMKYIDYPVEYDKERDYFYLVSLVFGSKLTMRDQTIHIYEEILSGRRRKYPIDYFLGSDGMVRAGLCLQYVVSNFLYFTSANDMYSFFACEEGYVCLRKYRLLNACRESFDTPVDFLHFALPLSQRNMFFFYYYKFKFLKEMMTPTGRKRQTDKKYKLEVAEE